jgi:hypothetical protein
MDSEGKCWDDCTIRTPEPVPELLKLKDELTPDVIRMFASGATRDTREGKLDFEAYLSPLVLVRYAEYMQKHQTRSDGTQREGDDWQKGMGKDVYAESLLRHLIDFWLLNREHEGLATQDIQDALCGVIFNAMGYLFNELTGFDG